MKCIHSTRLGREPVYILHSVANKEVEMITNYSKLKLESKRNININVILAVVGPLGDHSKYTKKIP